MTMDRERLTRRRGLQNLGMAGVGIGLQSLLARESPGSTSLTHFAPRAKRLIVLFQSGAPSQLDLFDPKPVLHVIRQPNVGDVLAAVVNNDHFRA